MNSAPRTGRKHRAKQLEWADKRGGFSEVPVGDPGSNMRSAFERIAVTMFLSLTFQYAALACKCVGSSSVCEALATSDVVFAGRVEATDPDFDPWDADFRKRVADVFPGRDLDDVDLDKEMTAEALERLKTIYSAVFPEPYRTAIRSARNQKDVEAAMEKAMDRGKRVTFQINRAFKGIPSQQAVIDIWTDFSDCGVRFSKGETYLVYASGDKTGRYGTGACSRTDRLTDAGQDLAYFFFRENAAGSDGRIYGFLTSNQLDLRTPRFWDHVSAPIADVPVELRVDSSGVRLLSETNREGRFVFDGLQPGRYEIAVLDPTSPEERKQLGEVRRVQIERSACKAEVIYAPKAAESKK